MPKRPVSVTLDAQNLVWLQGLAGRGAAKNVSDAIDRLVSDARTKHGSLAVARSVVGTIDLPIDDPSLEQADVAIRGMFEQSLSRPFLVRETAEKRRPARRRKV